MDYVINTMGNLLHQTAFFNLTWGNYVMILVALVFLYLAIVKGYEPLLLVPISFGMLLVNLCPGIMAEPMTTYYNSAGEVVCYLTGHEYTNVAGEVLTQPIAEIMATVDPSKTVETAGGLLHYFFMLYCVRRALFCSSLSELKYAFQPGQKPICQCQKCPMSDDGFLSYFARMGQLEHLWFAIVS